LKTLSETISEAERSALLRRVDCGEQAPVFDEAWQAQAFALAVSLSEQGHYTWEEWSQTLAAELKAAADRGDPDIDGSRYYEHWLAALEKLAAAKNLADPGSVRRYKEAWTEAYEHTPHGQPVELRYDPLSR
jgi:nitrile hydratase accessory protein